MTLTNTESGSANAFPASQPGLVALFLNSNRLAPALGHYATPDEARAFAAAIIEAADEAEKLVDPAWSTRRGRSRPCQ